MKDTFFSSVMAQAYPSITIQRFIMLKLQKSVSGTMRHHFQTWIGQHRGQTLTPLRTFRMCWKRFYIVLCLSHHQYYSLTKKIYANLDRNKCCDMCAVNAVLEKHVILCCELSHSSLAWLKSYFRHWWWVINSFGQKNFIHWLNRKT